MSDQSYAGRLKHAAALLGLAITEAERNDLKSSAEHLAMAAMAIDEGADALLKQVAL